MIQQVIVVEGKSDIARVRQAVDADLIATGGYALRSAVIQDIRAAYDFIWKIFGIPALRVRKMPRGKEHLLGLYLASDMGMPSSFCAD